MKRFKRLGIPGLIAIMTCMMPLGTYGQDGNQPGLMSNWYFGKRYMPATKPVSGSPNLNNKRLFQGNVLFNHQVYYNQPLFYDLEKNVLVLLIEPKDGVAEYIELAKSNVEWFELEESGDRFVSVDEGRSTKTGLKEGYYQLIYSNELTLLREFKKVAVVEDGRLTYKQFDDLLLGSGFENFASVKTKSRFLKNYEVGVKTLLKKYIQESDKKYENLTDQELVQLMAYVESLGSS